MNMISYMADPLMWSIPYTRGMDCTRLAPFSYPSGLPM